MSEKIVFKYLKGIFSTNFSTVSKAYSGASLLSKKIVIGFSFSFVISKQFSVNKCY